MRAKGHNGDYLALAREQIKALEEKIEHLENVLKQRGG